MKRIILAELKRSVNKWWLISIVGVMFCICFDSWNDLMNALVSGTGTVHYFFKNSSYGGVCKSYLLPVFATLPFAASFCEELKGGAISSIVAREGKKGYCAVKFSVNALCGGTVVAVATAVLLMLLLTQFPLTRTASEDVFLYSRFHEWVARYNPSEYIWLEIWSGFLRGTFFSSVALCLSIFIPDALVIYVSPYIMEFVIVHTYRILRVSDTYRLDKLITGNMIVRSSRFTMTICTLVVFLFNVLLWLMFKHGVSRRFRDGSFT